MLPLLTVHHRVVAVSLRGFGDSRVAGVDHSSGVAAENLDQLVRYLDLGPELQATASRQPLTVPALAEGQRVVMLAPREEARGLRRPGRATRAAGR